MSLRRPSAQRARAIAVTALPLIVALALSACGVPPTAVRPVIATSADASSAIAAAYTHDLRWLRACIAASLDTQRTILLGQTHRALIADGLITPLGHDPQALHRQLDAAAASNTPPKNPLLAEVFAARLTRLQAERFLNDYAVAASMSPEQSRAIRHAMLADLPPLRAHDESAHAILQAFDGHAQRIADLFQELSANHEAIAAALDPPSPAASPLREPALWQPILEHIEDPLLRAAAEQLLIAARHHAPGPFAAHLHLPQTP